MGTLVLARPTLRSRGKRLFVWLLVAVLVLATVAVVYLSTPFRAQPGEVEALAADDDVTLERTEVGYVLEPTADGSRAGLVFYPGARVHPEAYLPALAPLVREAGITVVVPEMPAHLAVVDYGLARVGLGTDAAAVARAETPGIEDWYVGGHSLGGAMACRYATLDDDLDGLVLYGSYCDRDLSDRDLAVLSVVGRADTILDREAYERGVTYLPPSARVEVVDGVNHTQFASYTGQDEPSGTSYETAHERVNAIAVPWFQNRTSPAGDSRSRAADSIGRLPDTLLPGNRIVFACRG